ncbi:MAG TPA: nuclear transport factor 2 family protein [Candidatus Acidoferrum sp.]|nr:nuclear transport factor 2 family protein [Candidatus Acidoferrum sp.]
MSNHHGTRFAGRTVHQVILLLLATALSLTCVSPAAAQKKKKSDPPPSTDRSKMLVSLTDEQQIDYTLSEMLGAWQLGDIEKLRSDYGDDVAIVNGSWAPPILGWTNYLAVYQQQRARMQQVRMDRTNTYIKVSGTVGWACYQWDFEAVVDGQQMASQGQTTVVLEKRNNHWVIVLNHTSIPPRIPQAAPANAPSGQQQPAKPTPR